LHREDDGDVETPVQRRSRRVYQDSAVLDRTVSHGHPRDPVLARLKAALAAAYGAGLERVVLFGSGARGDTRPDSDYDVAVFLKDYGGFGREAARIATIETDILYDTGAVINALPFRAGAYDERAGLTYELRRAGRDL